MKSLSILACTVLAALLPAAEALTKRAHVPAVPRAGGIAHRQTSKRDILQRLANINKRGQLVRRASPVPVPFVPEPLLFSYSTSTDQGGQYQGVALTDNAGVIGVQQQEAQRTFTINAQKYLTGEDEGDDVVVVYNDGTLHFSTLENLANAQAASSDGYPQALKCSTSPTDDPTLTFLSCGTDGNLQTVNFCYAANGDLNYPANQEDCNQAQVAVQLASEE